MHFMLSSFRQDMRACRRLCSTSRSLLQGEFLSHFGVLRNFLVFKFPGFLLNNRGFRSVSELQCGSRFASAASVGRVSAPCSSRTFTTSAQTSSVEKSREFDCNILGSDIAWIHSPKDLKIRQRPRIVVSFFCV